MGCGGLEKRQLDIDWAERRGGGEDEEGDVERKGGGAWDGRGPVTHTFQLLQELRLLRCMTQRELAERLGMQQSMISKLEQRKDPSLRAMRSYVGGLGGDLFITVRLGDAMMEYDLGEDAPPSSR